MSDDTHSPAFEQPDLFDALETLNDQQLDGLAFGVIGFSRDGMVKRYNRFETEATGLSQDYVLGKHVFTQIAQCMNNFLVAQRYEDAWTSACPLDATIDYVLTWRMRPTSVKLRMLWGGDSDFAYVVLSPRRALGT